MKTKGARARFTVAVVAVLTLVAAACGKSGNEASSPSTRADLPNCPIDALDQATGPVDVVLWHFLSGETGAALQQLADEYNASQSKVRVHIESQGTTNDELWSKYQAGISSGDLPAIAVADDTVTVDIVDSGTVLPAQSCIQADNYDMSEFLQPAEQYYTIDGVLYPASVNLSGALLYYNKNHFRRAGLDPNTTPQTLDEVRQYAEKIKASGAVDKPVILKVGPPLIEMWLTGAGQPVVNNDNGRGQDQTTEAAFDTDMTVQLYSWVQQMQSDGLLTVVPDVPGTIDQYLGMAQQTASMTIETSTAATTIEKFLSGDTSVAQEAPGNADTGNVDVSALDIGAAPVPGINEAGRLQMGGGAWYMTNTQPPEVQAAAWDFMKFFNSESSQVTWNLRGSYLPYRTSAVDTPAIQDSWTNTTAGRWLAIAYDELLHGVDPSFPGPLMGPYDEFRKAIRSSVENMVFNGAAPSDVVSQAADETTAALQRYQDQNF
jgi:sn-glycerol 3-phosphate transport system substrate-binding protein